MNTVKQKHPLGCGIAAVATLSGLTYERAVEIWIEKCGGSIARLEGRQTDHRVPYGLNHLEVEALLAACGVNAEVRMTKRPIVMLTKRGPVGHWVAIDETGVVHDPA